MPYDASHDPYVDESTGILRNLVGATTQEELDEIEAEITTVIIATLTEYEPATVNSFSKSDLLELHKDIFETIYDWAGEFRTVDIGKEASYFAHASHIETFLDDIFRDLPDISIVARNRKDFVAFLAKFYGDLNAVHPFREGNGRTIRTFVRLFALNHGWDIEWDKMDPDENIAACKEAMKSDENLMRQMLDKLIKRIED